MRNVTLAEKSGERSALYLRGGLRSPGVGGAPLGVLCLAGCTSARPCGYWLWAACHHAMRFVGPLVGLPARFAFASVRVIVPFHWLHSRCMRLVLLRSSGEPPRARGRSSSTSARRGCGTQPMHSGFAHRGPCEPCSMVSVLSTRSPHSAQWSSLANTRARSSRRRWPLALAGPTCILSPTFTVWCAGLPAIWRPE